MTSPRFCALPAPTRIGFGISKGISLVCHFNVHISCLWIWLAPFWPCWCRLPLLPHGAGNPRLSIPTAYFFLVLNWCSTNFTECHQILALQGLVNICADSAYPHPSWFSKPQSSLPAHMATPSPDHFTCPICTLSCILIMRKTLIMNNILLTNCLQERSHKMG